MKADFEAIFFDLFDTLLHFDRARIPVVESAKGPRYSTALVLYEALSGAFSVSPSREEFVRHNLELDQELAEARRGGQEVSAVDRFRTLTRRLELQPECSRVLLETHMRCLRGTLFRPSGTRATLRGLQRYRLFVASNFDHAETARQALADFRLLEFFEAVFVSETIGWRKPHAEFFRAVLEGADLDAARCLFVGDDLEADIAGAARVGFNTVWLSPGKALAGGIPTLRIERLSDLPGLLEESGRRGR